MTGKIAQNGEWHMGVELVLGSSGVGKTHYIYDKITGRDKNENFFAIVPEQYTMETQKKIVEMCKKKGGSELAAGTLNIDIVSFNRLAVRIFEETGDNPKNILDDTGKVMVLRKVMEQEKDKLKIFKSKIKYTGFVDEVKSLISEFYQYGIDSNKIEELEKNAESKPVLQSKLHDIKIIEAAFKNYLSDKYITSEELMDRLCKAIPKSELIKNSTVTLDGYTGFTTLQYRVIDELIRHARDVIITVTVSPDSIGKENNESGDLFALSNKTIRKIEDLAADNNYKVRRTILEADKPYRYAGHEEICWLEKNLFSYRAVKYKNNTDAISVVEAADIDAECRYISEAVNYYVRNKGYRYKDIAVITGDIESYGHHFEKNFSDYNIPAFIDKTRGMSNNPFIESIRALMVTVQENYSYESMFRFLRCGMIDILREEIDVLENYVISHGIRSYKRWNDIWEDAPERVENTRQELMDFLNDIYKAFKKRNATVRDYCKTVYEYMLKCDGQNKLTEYVKMFEADDNLRMAREYGQIYTSVIELLDKVVFLMGDEVIPLKQYIDIMDSGFEEIKVGVVPPVIDRVIVGDIERTRVENIKILFFAGVNDGIIPKSASGKGILSEIDRSYLEEFDVELAPSTRESALIQKFYLYTIMTKMSDRLILTYSRSSSDGGNLRPSYIISSVLTKFPSINVCQAENAVEDIGINTKKTLEKKVVTGLRNIVAATQKSDTKWKEMFSVIEPERRENILNGAFYKDMTDNLNRAVAKAVYGDTLRGSVSRLETFASCAYRHFLAYGLSLQPRKQYEVKPADIGIFYHSTLERFSKNMKEYGLDWKNVDDSVRRDMLKKSFDEVVAQYGNGVMNATARDSYRLKRMYDIADRTVWALCSQLSKGEFNPEGFEIRFDADKTSDTMEFNLDEGLMKLNGVIDRIDLYETDENIFVKIIDYKSGNKKFDIVDVYNGIQLQLVLYMEAAKNMIQKAGKDKEVIPAGIFYYDIKNPVIKNETSEPYNEILKELKPSGLVNSNIEIVDALDRDAREKGSSDVIPVIYTKNGISKKSSVATTEEFRVLTDYVYNKTGELGNSIMEGCISKNPYRKNNSQGDNPCTFCDYKSVCRFDIKLNGNDYRRLDDIAKDEVIELMKQKNDSLQKGGKE